MSRLSGAVAVGAWVLASVPLAASYANLISTADGSAVFFEAPTGFRGTGWYRAQFDGAQIAVTEVDSSLADVSGDGATLASSTYGERYCSFAGSTCWTAPACNAGFAVDGPAGRVTGAGRRTFLRLSRDGRRAWIEQSTVCRGQGFPIPAEYQGLYELPGVRLVFALGGMTMANTRAGRRLITSGSQVLVFNAGRQMHLLGEAGAREVRHQYGASEAVIDAAGRNIVYTDGSPGRVRWIDLTLQTEEDLAEEAISGSAPALSDDGAMLVFLSAAGRLTLYTRATRHVTTLGAATEFTLSGDGRFVFAVTPENRLLRIDTATGESQTWIEPLPEIRGSSTLLERDPESCALICYSVQEPMARLGRGSLVVLSGRYFQEGWRVRLGGADLVFPLLGDDAAWFQVPFGSEEGRSELEVWNPGHPLRFRAKGLVSERFPNCFGALHQPFDRLVTAQDPAAVGEAVHLFLTGLRGEEWVPDGVANPSDHLVNVLSPPAIGGDGALKTLFFGLAPGFIGLQQLDLLVVSPTTTDQPLFPDYPSAPNCVVPPTAR